MLWRRTLWPVIVLALSAGLNALLVWAEPPPRLEALLQFLARH